MATPTDPRSIQATNELLGQQAALWSSIASNASTLVDALNRVSGAAQGATQSSQQLNNSLAAAIQNAADGVRDIGASQEAAAAQGEAATRRANQSISSMVSDFEDAGNALERFQRDLERQKLEFGSLFDFGLDDKFEIYSDAANKFGQNLEGSFAAANKGVMTLVSGVGALAGGLFNIAKAAFAIPFQLLGMVAETGNELLEGGGGGGGGGGDNSFQLALEDVREKFGNIAEGEGARVVAMYEKINTSQSNIAGTGRTMADVFGKNAEALKAMSEMYEGLGPLVHVLGQDIEENADKLTIYTKGLGLGAEEMQAFGSQAIAAGKPLTSVLEDASRMAISLGKKFGISSKGIAKDLAYMSSGVTKFGNIGMKMIGSVSVYMKKLGMEVKDLEGVMGVFDDFESGAQASAKLSSAFGVQLDNMKMMQAANPAEQIQALRDAFKQSGQSLEGLSRQQLKYLGDTTGLGDKVLQALSPENAQTSLEDAQSAAADAASDTNKQLLKQTEILKILATNIKKIPAEGGGGGGADKAKDKFTSFIDAFTSGFKKAIFETESYKTMAKNVAESMGIMGEAGGKVGSVFLATFPQVEKIFTAIGDLFDPAKFRVKAEELTGIFQSFFGDLKSPATADKAFQNLFDSLMDWFGRLFDNPEAKGTLTESIEQMIEYMGNAISGAIGYLIPKIAEIITEIADFISGNKAEKTINEAASTGIGGAFRKAFDMIGDKLVEVWPKLSEALGKLIDVVLEKAKPYIMKAMIAYMTFVMVQGVLIGGAQAMASAVIGKTLERFGTFLTIKMKEMVAKRAAAAAADAATTAAATTTQAAASTAAAGAPAATAAAAGTASSTAATGGLVATVNAIPAKSIIEATGKLILMAAGLFVAMAAFVLALAGIHILITKVGGYAAVLSSLGTVAATVAVVAGIILVSQLIQPPAAGTAAVGLSSAVPVLAAAGVLLLGAIALSALAKVMKVSPTELLGYGLAMAAIVAMLTLIVLAAYALLGVAPDGGATAATTLATVGTVVLIGTGVFLAAAIALIALGITPERMAKAENIILSAAKIVGAIGFMVLTALGLGFIVTNPFTLGSVAVGILALAGFLVIAVPALASMLKSITEIKLTDPESSMKKVEIIKGVFAILDPMFKLVEKVMDQSDGWATSSSTAANNVKIQLESITTFFNTTLTALAGFVKTIIELASGIPTVDKSQMEKAEIFGKMISPVASLAGALLGSIGNIKSEAAEYNWMGNTTKSAITMESQLNAIKDFILGPEGDGKGEILNSIVNVLPTIVNAIKDMTALNLDAKGLESLGKKAEVVGSMVKAVGDMTSVFTEISNAAVAMGTETEKMDKSAVGFGYVKETSVVNIQKIKDFAAPNGPFMTIFGTLKEMIPTIVSSFNSLPEISLGGAKDPKERIESVGGAISSMMNGIRSLTGMFPEDTDLQKKNQTLATQAVGIKALATTTTGIMQAMLTNFSTLPALDVKKFEGIEKGMQAVGNLGSYTSSIHSATEALRSLATSNLSTLVHNSVDTIRKIDDELASIDNINIEARIEKVGKALALRPDSLKIDPKPVNINIKLNFTLDAKDLAREIRDVTAQMAVTGEITDPFVSQTPAQ